jgi:hypothetical protein
MTMRLNCSIPPQVRPGHEAKCHGFVKDGQWAMNGLMDEIGGLVDWWIGGLVDWWMNGLMDEWIDG